MRTNLFDDKATNMTKLEFAMPIIEYCGMESYMDTGRINKYRLNMRNYLDTILLYTPKNNVRFFNLVIKDNNGINNCPNAQIENNGEFFTIILPETINTNICDLTLELALENNTNGLEQQVHIYGFGSAIYCISKGRMDQICDYNS